MSGRAIDGASRPDHAHKPAGRDGARPFIMRPKAAKPLASDVSGSEESATPEAKDPPPSEGRRVSGKDPRVARVIRGKLKEPLNGTQRAVGFDWNDG